MQDSTELFDTISQVAGGGVHTFEVFTNGSFRFPMWTKYLGIRMLYMMDWKLGGSGESMTKLEVRKANVQTLYEDDSIKFVVTSEEDLDQALGWASIIRNELGFLGTFWVAAAFGKIQEKDLVDWMLTNRVDWKLNVQVHKHIWNPDAQGV